MSRFHFQLRPPSRIHLFSSSSIFFCLLYGADILHPAYLTIDGTQYSEHYMSMKNFLS